MRTTGKIEKFETFKDLKRQSNCRSAMRKQGRLSSLSNIALVTSSNGPLAPPFALGREDVGFLPSPLGLTAQHRHRGGAVPTIGRSESCPPVALAELGASCTENTFPDSRARA